MNELTDIIKKAATALTGKTVATAESCTGGLVGAALTSLAGSSSYYQGGIIAYDNSVKIDLLGVSKETLKANGAVSSETAIEMARGARLRVNTDIGISTTGIAGPEGGTEDKPVGTVFIALSTEDGDTVEARLFKGNRDEIREATVLSALELLIKTIK